MMVVEKGDELEKKKKKKLPFVGERGGCSSGESRGSLG